MQINSISSVNNNSSNQPNFMGGTRPIFKRINPYTTTTTYPRLGLLIQRIERAGGNLRETTMKNLKSGKIQSKIEEGYRQGSNVPYYSVLDPKTGKINRYFQGYGRRYSRMYINPTSERGLFYDSKNNLMGDLYLENGNSYRFEPKKTTLVERIKAARQEKSVKGFINRLLGKKAQIICTKYNSEVKPIGQTELPPLSIEDVLRMDASGELSKLCK